MALETTPLWNAVKEVLNGNTPNAFFAWECKIFAGKDIITPNKLVNIELVEDYNKNFCDELSIEVLMGYGDFLKYVIPNESNLIIEIKKTPIGENNDGVNSLFKLEATKYRAVLKEQPYGQVKGSTPKNMNLEGANLSRLETIHFQLLDLTIESLRGRQIGGIFNNVSCKDVCMALLTKETLKDQSTTTYLFKGVDCIPPETEELRTHVVIPDGLPLLDLPVYLQAKQGGMYNAGMGYYYKRGVWYLYPEFDITRFQSTPNTLTVLVIPSNKMPHVEKTFSIKSKSLTILVTGQLQHNDNVEQKVFNQGNGARYASADALFAGDSKWDNGKATLDRSNNTSEFIVNPRETNVNYATVTGSRITANSKVELSKLAERFITQMQVEWHNCDSSLLYPGMPIKAIFEHDNSVQIVYGVLGGGHYWTTGDSNSMTSKRHVTNGVLNLFLDKVGIENRS